MPDCDVHLYSYKLVDGSGNVLEGKVFAQSHEEVGKSHDGVIVRCKKCNLSMKKPVESFTIPFLSNLHRMLKNKVELMTSLYITKHLFKDRERQAIVDFIIRKIKTGSRLSETFSCFGRCFDKFSIKSIEIAEQIGRLPAIMESIVERLNSTSAIKKRVRSALTYPIILLAFTSVVMFFWILFVIPKFGELFSDVGINTSCLTKCVLAIGSFGSEYTVTFLTIFLSPFISLFFLLKSTKLLRKIPMFWAIKRELLVINFFYCMSIVVQEKFNLLDGIDCLGDMDDLCIIGKISASIREGRSLSSSMEMSGLFKEYEIAIVKSGEKSGDLASSFRSAYEILLSNFSCKLERIVGLVQPATVAVVGILLLTITYSVITPIYSSIDVVS
jgi:type IV pilus assembly protein PilC